MRRSPRPRGVFSRIRPTAAAVIPEHLAAVWGRARPRTRGSVRSVSRWGRAASGSGYRRARPRASPRQAGSWTFVFRREARLF